MELHQYCGSQRRRQRVAASRVQLEGLEINGIDYLEVLDSGQPESLRQRVLELVFIKSDGVREGDTLLLSADNFILEGGQRIRHLQVERVQPGATEHSLLITLNSYGDFSRYTLRVRRGDQSNLPPANMDPQLSAIEFSFKADCPSSFDCCAPQAEQVATTSPVQLDYLAKDFSSFMHLMSERMAVSLAGWQGDNAADFSQTLLEVLAYSADQTSYFQDVVATESYLSRAHRRTSVRRHARLLGYPVDEGCNARVFVAISARQDVPEQQGPALTKGTRLLTGISGSERNYPAVLAPSAEQLRQMRRLGAIVFETIEPLTSLRVARNRMHFHTWGETLCCLPVGATVAHLQGTQEQLGLKRGDVLILEELVPAGARANSPANPLHRQAVRLCCDPQVLQDPLLEPAQPLLEIRWYSEDALTFALNLEGIGDLPGAIARGNIVLADHGFTQRYGEPGQTYRQEDDPRWQASAGLSPAQVGKGLYRPQLEDSQLTYAAYYEADLAAQQAACQALVSSDVTQPTLPQIHLEGGAERWYAQTDLLSSDRFAPHFVVEPESDRRISLRFGDDQFGKRPGAGSHFSVHLRTGCGSQGNVGAHAIAHIMTDNPDWFEAVDNPLAACGGREPETLSQIKLNAPQAFKQPLRAVTCDDYARFAESHPQVQSAVAERRWTGSWHSQFIYVDRRGGLPVDSAFKSQLIDFLQHYRLAGHDLQIGAAIYVPLDIALVVCVAPNYYASDVERRLLNVFSAADKGFFHPDNFSFNQSVKLSVIIARAMQVSGVRWVGSAMEQHGLYGRFRRLHNQSQDFADSGVIPIGQREIARLDSDPNAPEQGRIEFIMEGGQ